MYRKNKSLGQHFLADQNVLNDILNHIEVSPNEEVYEIGPGAGALTDCLIRHGLVVKAIELDKRWCHWLKKKYDEKVLKVINQDALQFSWQVLCAEDVVVGNLPYNIASELMCSWVESQVTFKNSILMMQKEVADRAMASPGSKHYGRLSIVLQTYFKVDPLLNVPPEAFDPPPKVQSSVIRLSLLPEKLCSFELLEPLRKVTAAAFSQRRKKCKHGLAVYFTVQDLKNTGIDPELRPEFLEVNQFIQLAEEYKKNSC